MKFKSTRGKVSGVSYEDAVCSGYAADGGLFVPEELPTVTPAFVRSLASLERFEDVAFAVLRLFISDEEIPETDLKSILRDAFKTFPDPATILPVRDIGGGLSLGELFHGPTLSFKDFGQQMLIRLVNYFTRRAGTRRCLLVATTGDTGPAAIHAVKDCSTLSIVCGYPKGQVSRLQELQMTTVAADNVCVYAFEGGGDDMDGFIKNTTTDAAFAAQYNLCGVNSINLARVTSQVCHYFWLYLRLAFPTGLPTDAATDADAPLPVVVFNVPTGAMGNIVAGYLARLLGLPLALSCSVNANNIVHRAVATGVYDVSVPMRRTLSEAINTQCPYNMERMLYYLSNQDAAGVSSFYTALKSDSTAEIPAPWRAALRRLIRTIAVTDDEMLNTVRDAYASSIAVVASTADATDTVDAARAAAAATVVVLDPHSAVAVAGARLLKLAALPAETIAALNASRGLWPDSDSDADAGAAAAPAAAAQLPVCVLATAHPAKFAEATTAALGADTWRSLFFDSETSRPGPLMPAGAASLYSVPDVPEIVFKAGEDWQARLRALVEAVATKQDTAAATAADK